MFILLLISIQISVLFCYKSKFNLIGQHPNNLEAPIKVLSSEIEISDAFYKEYSFENSMNLTFVTPLNHKKYLIFGITAWDYNAATVLTIENESKKIVYQNEGKYFENKLKLTDFQIYTMKYTLKCLNSKSTCKVYLYLMQSDYTEMIPVNMDKDYDFPIIGNLSIVVNISSSKNKILFQYNKEWYSNSETFFSAKGYDTNKVDNIIDKKGESLVITHDKCENDICQDYITKSSSNLKLILFDITAKNKDYKFIKFKFENYKSFLNHPIYSCLLGLCLAIPNIICYITRKVRQKMSASFCTFFMNVLLNMTYGNLIGGLVGIGNETSLLIAIYLGSIYGGFCLLNLFLLCCGVRAYFDVIFHLCQKIEDSSSLQEMINFNRKLYPLIVVGCYADHQESREVWTESEEYDKPVYKTVTTTTEDGDTEETEVFSHYEKDYRYITTHYADWERVDRGGGKIHGIPGHTNSKYDKTIEYRTVETWRKSEEFRYKSWQDETINIENLPYYTIVETTFSYNLAFDPSANNSIKALEDKLYKEGKKYDTDVHTYENKDVPNFVKKNKCSLNDEEYQRIKNKFSNSCGYFCWTFLFILGYSSIFESYSRYEIGKISINITKKISGQTDKRASYKSQDESAPPISITFSYTKLQSKAIEKKMKQGKILSNDLEYPLNTVY